jgi:hypothetical protein
MGIFSVRYKLGHLRVPSVFVAILAGLLCCTLTAAGTKQPTIDIRQPTIVAFFPPVTQQELKDGETNEALSDFKHYAALVRQPLQTAGIRFEEVYERSFRTRSGDRIATFHPAKGKIGYYLVAPDKKPRIEYGVMTNSDLLGIAREYFGVAIK